MRDKFLPGKKKAVIQVLFEQSQILDITGPLEVFSEADRLVSQTDNDPEKGYDIWTVSRHVGPVRTSSGLQLLADFSFDSWLEKYSDCGVDTLLISGGSGVDDACRDKKLIEFVWRVSGKAQRIVSICNGVFILATAGLLSGIKVTTHWAVELELSERYPDILLDSDKIHINDGRFYSSAGVTAGIDLALFLVEKDYGRQVALAIAKNLVMFMKQQRGKNETGIQTATGCIARGI